MFFIFIGHTPSKWLECIANHGQWTLYYTTNLCVHGTKIKFKETVTGSGPQVTGNKCQFSTMDLRGGRFNWAPKINVNLKEFLIQLMYLL